MSQEHVRKTGSVYTLTSKGSSIPEASPCAEQQPVETQEQRKHRYAQEALRIRHKNAIKIRHQD